MAKNRFLVWHLNTIRLVRCKSKMFFKTSVYEQVCPMPIHPPQQRQWTIDQYPVNASDHWSSVGEVEKGQTLIRGNQGGLHNLLFFFLCLLFLLLFSLLILVCFTSIAPVSSFLSSFHSLAHPFYDFPPIFFTSLSLFSSFSSSSSLAADTTPQRQQRGIQQASEIDGHPAKSIFLHYYIIHPI